MVAVDWQSLPIWRRSIPDWMFLKGLRARCNSPVDPTWFYNTVAGAGVDYGPSFRLMQAIGSGDGESLAFLQLPAGLTQLAKGYSAYPGLLDAAVQSLGISFFEKQTSSKDVYMPVAVDEYRLPPVGITEMWCHAVPRPGQTG